MKAIINTIVFFLLSGAIYAQQDARFTQYIFNELILNPAYAGSKEIHNIGATYAASWAGFNGTPSVQTISYDGPVSKNMGLGVHFINDMIGAQMRQGLMASYAYHLRLNEKWRLGLGLGLGLSYNTLNGSKLVADEADDPAIPLTKESKLSFDAQTGIFAHNERFYAGFSVTNLLAGMSKSENILVPNASRHYYLTAGYLFDISTKFKLKPSFLISEDFKSPTNIDISLYGIIIDKIWLGANYRVNTTLGKKNLDNSLYHQNAVAFDIGWYIIDRLRIGYAYTLTLTTLKNYSGHEVAIGYYFPSKVSPQMKSPRYF
ncbi:MAG TPA: type IX secretion system membrane protein PorP/SprF [Bacteroidales bacterium]|nr:type IX secretion system membrane protein PorP/SprF [Bacteroidales bacterium]HQI70050.1 type IX secretion system membrane protein PorP/SprF [Bacteroidales bacterium]